MTFLIWVGISCDFVRVCVEFNCVSCGNVTIAHIRTLTTVHLVTVLVNHKRNTFSSTILWVPLIAGQAINRQSKGSLETISQNGDLLVVPDLSLLVPPLGRGELPTCSISQRLGIFHQVHVVCNLDLEEVGLTVLTEIVSK